MTTSNKGSIHPTAEIHPTAIIEGDVTIGAYSRVGAGTVLTGTITVGHHTLIHCNVAIRGRNTIGSYVHIYDRVNIEGGRPGGVGSVTCDEPDTSLIGDYCWVNHGATMHGSQLEEGAALCINACLD